MDHCHESHKIRGLLCAKCNMAVGLIRNSPELAEKMASYLRRPLYEKYEYENRRKMRRKKCTER